jgi:hypothetical protein
MGQYNKNKIKQLIARWPRGTVHTSNYLHAAGYGYDLLAKYKRNGWIISVGRGAWRLNGDEVDWSGAVYAVQQELGLPIHFGGKTVVEEKGHGHFVMMGRKRCYLFGPKGTRLPNWLTSHDWGVDLHYRATSLFTSALAETLVDLSFGQINCKASTLERAVFEMLYFVPARQGYDEAQRIMGGMLSLRPGLVQLLLENCSSVKVKRLFMVLAEETNMPWLQDVELGKVDFGQGERQLVRDGVWNKKYQITIPANKNL